MLSFLASATPRTFTTSTGKSVVSAFTDDEAAAVCATLPGDFAKSLTSCQRHGKLSPRQQPWLHVLAVEATAPPAPEPEPERGAGDVVDLLATAVANGMQRPAIRCTVDDADGRRVSLRFSRAPSDGKNAGCAYVKAGDVYVGKITPAGGFVVSARAEAAPFLGAVRVVFAAVEADAQGFFAQNGRETGTCCYCARDLTDDRSKVAGYGPVCAKRYGLPWGTKPGATAA